VDASDGKYSVFGAQTKYARCSAHALLFFLMPFGHSRTHMSLNTLVSFHQKVAVSKTGTKLTNPVGNPRGNDSMQQLLA
jgi:hypothetical protein